MLGMSARLADTLEQCIPAILDEWGRAAAEGELRTLCDEDRAGDLAAVLRAMSTALHPRPLPGAVDQFIEIAAAHGARRRAQGVHEACLFEEYDYLGAAVPHGLRAFHRGEFERRGTWAEVMARTASESSDHGAGAPAPRSVA